MGFEFFVASRYLVSRRKQTLISIISIMSVLGVALGVGALVVVMGVYNGFTTDIRDKILGANAHIMLLSPVPYAFDAVEIEPESSLGVSSGADSGAVSGSLAETSTETGSVAESDTVREKGKSPRYEGGYVDIMQKVREIPGVRAATPYLYTEVLISTPNGATGLVIRGIDPVQAQDALPMLRELEVGNSHNLLASGAGPQGILIGAELAKRFGLSLGSRVSLMSPAGQRTTAGFVPKLKTYKVAGIFKAGMNDYDSRLAFISLESAQDLIGMPKGRVSGIEVYLNDPYAAREVGAEMESLLGDSFYARNWMDINSGLFAALELERIGMFIVLAMVVLVGSFSIITSLVMLVMEKTRDIAILMSMGATAKSIRRIFMLQGTIIGMAGTALGYAGGLGLAWLLKHYQFIELPPGVYTMDKLPMLISVPDTIIIGVVSMLMCFLATIYPARQAARLVPAEALRYE